MEQRKALVDLGASLNIMHANIEIFHEGNFHLYRVIASELRKLLCDGHSTLLPRIFPGLTLHPHLGYISRQMEEEHVSNFGSSIKELMESMTVMMPAHVHMDGKGGARIVRLFDETATPLDLSEWLAQPLFNKKITIQDLIRSVADKEAAHSDLKYNDTLNFLRAITIADQSPHVKYIVAIGEYMLQRIGPVYAKEIAEFKKSGN